MNADIIISYICCSILRPMLKVAHTIFHDTYVFANLTVTRSRTQILNNSMLKWVMSHWFLLRATYNIRRSLTWGHLQYVFGVIDTGTVGRSCYASAPEALRLGINFPALMKALHHSTKSYWNVESSMSAVLVNSQPIWRFMLCWVLSSVLRDNKVRYPCSALRSLKMVLCVLCPHPCLTVSISLMM